MTDTDALVAPGERPPEPEPPTRVEEPTRPLVTLSRVDGVDMLTVHGEIDMATAPDLEAAFQGLGPDIVVDMRGVAFMDSSGIAVLVRAKGDGNRIRIHASRQVVRILQITGLDGTFEVIGAGSGPAAPSPDQ